MIPSAQKRDRPQRPPLTVLIAADTYPPDVNGAAQFSYRLAKNLQSRGHSLHVMAARTSRGPSYTELRPEAQVHRLRSHAVPTHESYRVCFPWGIARDVRRTFDRIQPDVVHIQCHYMIGKAVAEEAIKRGIRLIATNHFMPENLNPFLPFPGWFLEIVTKNSWRDMGKVMRQADVVTTPTPRAAEAMRERAGLGQVLPVSNGIDMHAYQPRPGETLGRPEHPTVLYVGRLAEEKNIDVLIDAISRLPSGLDAHVEIVGSGENRAGLEALVRSRGLERRISFLGGLSDEQLRRAYLRATVFVMPGTAELQSLASLEAASAATPLILADAMALPHLIERDKNGLLFRPGDSADLANKIAHVLALSEEERRAMGEASFALASKHSIQCTLDTFEDLYYGVAPSGPTGRVARSLERVEEPQ